MAKAIDPGTFKSGETYTAAKHNARFTPLYDRLEVLDGVDTTDNIGQEVFSPDRIVDTAMVLNGGRDVIARQSITGPVVEAGILTLDELSSLILTPNDTTLDDATPSVADGTFFYLNASAALNVTDFDDAVGEGQLIMFYVPIQTGDQIMKHDVTKIHLEGNADFGATRVSYCMGFLRIDIADGNGVIWHEIFRSDHT